MHMYATGGEEAEEVRERHVGAAGHTYLSMYREKRRNNKKNKKKETYISLSLSLSVYIYIYIDLSIYLSICLSIYISLYMREIYIYIYIYIHPMSGLQAEGIVQSIIIIILFKHNKLLYINYLISC